MGKNKSQKRAFKKDPVATKVAAGVKKTKTKAVVSNLKKITFQNRSKTEDLDLQFAKIQPTSLSKKGNLNATDAAASETARPSKAEIKKSTKRVEKEAADVDMAVAEFSKLVSQ